jgi:hypothetical protein
MILPDVRLTERTVRLDKFKPFVPWRFVTNNNSNSERVEFSTL